MKAFSLILLGFLISIQSFAGLPPPSVQGRFDATAQTKFNIQVPYTQKTDLGGIKALLETGNENLLVNPGFEHTTYSTGWTIATASGAVSTTDQTSGKQAATITYSSQTGGISQDVTPDANLNLSGVQIEATCWVKTTLTTAQVCARQAGTDFNCQNAPASGTWQAVTSTVLGGAQNTSVGVDIKVSGSSTGNFIVDQCYVGKSRNLAQLSQAQSLGTATWVEGSAQQWIISSATTSYAAFPANSSMAAPTFSSGSAITATATKLPAVVLTSAGPGTYYVVANGSFYGGTNGKWPCFTIFDGTNNSGDNCAFTANATSNQASVSSIVGSFTYTTAQSNLQFSIYGRTLITTGNVAIGLEETSTDTLTLSVYYFPSQQQTGYRADAVPANWSGYQTVSGGCSTTSTTYADPSACTSIAVTQLANRNFGTVATAASSLPGITFTPPRLGNYLVCATAQLSTTLVATDSIRLIDSNSNVLNQGKSVTISAAGDGSVTVCGTEPVTSAGAVTVKLQLAASTSTAAIVNGAASGSSAIDWDITEKDSPMPAPYLQNSVSSNTSGQEHAERITFAGNAGGSSICSSSPCTIVSQSGSWVSSVTRSSTGVYVVNVAAGEFSGTPTCTYGTLGISNDVNAIAPWSSRTSTSITIDVLTSANAATDGGVDLLCFGPR